MYPVGKHLSQLHFVSTTNFYSSLGVRCIRNMYLCKVPREMIYSLKSYLKKRYLFIPIHTEHTTYIDRSY